MEGLCGGFQVEYWEIFNSDTNAIYPSMEGISNKQLVNIFLYKQ